jgi:hypothetical protein
MTEKAEVLTVYGKLLEVRKSIDYLQKKAKGGQYSYVSSSQVLGSLRAKLNEVGLLLIPAITHTVVTAYQTKSGTNSFFTELSMTMTWVDCENGHELSVPFYAQGVDLAGEKGTGKALTYAEKYFLLKSFMIPTDKDDPDAFQQEHEAPASQEEIKAGLIAELKVTNEMDRVTAIWSGNPGLKSDSAFAAAVKAAGTRLKPKDKAPEPTA